MSNIISRDALKALMSSGSKLTIIEALPNKYFATEHLPGAVNIPHDEIHLSAARLISGKNDQVIVYCASSDCQNSHMAAESLNKLGYRNVSVYAEGKKGWKEGGFPLVSSGGAK